MYVIMARLCQEVSQNIPETETKTGTSQITRKTETRVKTPTRQVKVKIPKRQSHVRNKTFIKARQVNKYKSKHP